MNDASTRHPTSVTAPERCPDPHLERVFDAPASSCRPSSSSAASTRSRSTGSSSRSLDGGRTCLVVTASFASVEARDAMLDAGTEHGVSEGYEKLDELLARRSA
ncbi:MAG: hypothetical protein ACRDLL_09755 [Solirubrobacterales bacterium]